MLTENKKQELKEGDRCGRLLIIKEVEKRGRHRYYRCRCDCGKTNEVRQDALRSRNTKSCGCLQREKIAERNHTHGGTGSPLYTVWRSMKARCTDKNSIGYGLYGGRGITLCQEWYNYLNFYHDMRDKYKQGLQLDRIDNNGPYSPQNCRWVTAKQNSRNHRSNRTLTLNNETRCLAEWAEITGINYKTLQYRINAGWSTKKVLGTEDG